jgi:hypothetical protein
MDNVTGRICEEMEPERPVHAVNAWVRLVIAEEAAAFDDEEEDPP